MLQVQPSVTPSANQYKIINKQNIQKSKLSLDDQNESCEINYKMNYNQKGLATEKEKIIFKNIIGKQNILESKDYDL